MILITKNKYLNLLAMEKINTLFTDSDLFYAYVI